MFGGFVGYSLCRAGGHGAVHGSNAAYETETEHNPRVCAHETKAPSVYVQCPRSNSDHAHAQASVHEGVVEISISS
jgi:hypothetical protein